MANTLQATTSVVALPSLGTGRESQLRDQQVHINSNFRQVRCVPKYRTSIKHNCTNFWQSHRISSRPTLNLGHKMKLRPIQGQMLEFKAKREVSIPFREGTLSAVDYLKESERVVRVTFPDSARITYLGDSVWRSRLKPITFFTVTATPICDIKVYNKGDALHIHSTRLMLDFSGLPDQFKNLNLNFKLAGVLRVDAGATKRNREVNFNGEVSLKLGADMPMPFSLLPEPLVTGAGDGILDNILGAMESALVRGIIADYHSWCWAKQSTQNKKVMGVGTSG